MSKHVILKVRYYPFYIGCLPYLYRDNSVTATSKIIDLTCPNRKNSHFPEIPSHSHSLLVGKRFEDK